jgi:hypothetical protein
MKFRSGEVPSPEKSRIVTPITTDTTASGVGAFGRVLVDNPDRTGVHNMIITAMRGVPTIPTRGPAEFSGNSTGEYRLRNLRDRVGLSTRTTAITAYPTSLAEPTNLRAPISTSDVIKSISYRVRSRGRIENVLRREAAKLDERIQ